MAQIYSIRSAKIEITFECVNCDAQIEANQTRYMQKWIEYSLSYALMNSDNNKLLYGI